MLLLYQAAMDAANKEVDPADEKAKGGSGEVHLPELAMSAPCHSLPATPIRHYSFVRSWISLSSFRASAGRQDAPVLGRHTAWPAVLRAGVEAGQVQRVRMDAGRSPVRADVGIEKWKGGEGWMFEPRDRRL
jgi:hypothetical protein